MVEPCLLTRIAAILEIHCCCSHGGQPERPGNSFLIAWRSRQVHSEKLKMKLPLALAAAFTTLAFAGTAFAGPAEDIIAKEKCGKCHTAQTTKKAPSWASVAEKYKGDAGAEAKVINHLKTGGKDDHLVVKASDADLKAISAIVLSSK
jgi:cytochrome c